MGVGGSGELQVGQCGQHETVRGVGCADDFVDAYRRRAEGFADGAEKGWRHIGVARIDAVGQGLVDGGRGYAFLGVEHVLGGFDQGGALFGQSVRSARARVKRRDVSRRVCPLASISC